MKQWKHAASTPEFLDFTIVDADAWRKAKERITPSDDRVNWDLLKTELYRPGASRAPGSRRSSGLASM